LRFAAVDYLADVWLNGEHLGHHEGYFAPFGFDVGDALRADNEVIVCVQDPLEPLDPSAFFFEHRKRVIKGTLKYHDSRPGGLPGRMVGPLVEGENAWVWTPEWGQSMTTGGITGPVTLERTYGVCLDTLLVTPLDAGRLHVAVVLTNHGDAPVPVRLHIVLDREHTAVACEPPSGSARIDAIVDASRLARWEPVGSSQGEPVLHDLSVSIADAGDRVLDRRDARVGLRSASVVTDDVGAPRWLEVNDHPAYVKAVNYIPWQHFAEVGRAFYDRDMRMIAEAHGNSVGVHAHVQAPSCYEAADDAGILVFQDFPLQWFYDSGTTTNPGFVDLACRQIAEMAYLLHNHPSVVYYACHNEPARMFDPRLAEDGPETDRGETHLDTALEHTLRSLDSGRHVHLASGIGGDVHDYQGSLTGGSLYRVGERPAWLVSEYGFWTVGPQAHKFGDRGWPPDVEQMREWVSRLSFIGSTCAFAGSPARYSSVEDWADATQIYGAALAKYQTEWFRAHRGDPFMGYRWHFWADWWGYAGGGLVDVERVPKATYVAYRDASRPLLIVALQDASVVAPGEVALPVVVVNDRAQPVSGVVEYDVYAATSAVIAPDLEGARIGLPMPPDPDGRVAVPRTRGDRVGGGALAYEIGPGTTAPTGTITVALEQGQARTVVLRWNDPFDGPQENFVHLHCPAEGERHPPGLTVIGA
jgi:beta-mannosidase